MGLVVGHGELADGEGGGGSVVGGMVFLEALFVPISVCKAGIALSHLVIGHIGIDILFGEHLHVLLGVEATVGGEGGLLEDIRVTDGFEVLLCTFNHGKKETLFLRYAEGLGVDDD